MPVRMDRAKAEAQSCLPPGHPGREAILVSDDELSEAEFDLLVPTWIRLLRLKHGEVE
jgi:hypothetical protein